MPLLLLPPPHCSGTIISVTLALMFYRSSLLLVQLYVINPKMFLSAMFVSSFDISISRHLILHNVLI
jgi:hypothetical protein